jgi:MFS family permease
MKPRVFTLFILFISAFSPLFIIIAVKDFDFCKNIFKHKTFIIIMLSIVVFSIIMLFFIISTFKKGDEITINKIENRSTDIINYTIPYLLSFISMDLSSPSDLISIGIFLTILMVLTITSKSIFINPILAIVGYGLYDVSYSYNKNVYSKIVLSKKELKICEKYHYCRLNQFMGIITEVVDEE